MTGNLRPLKQIKAKCLDCCAYQKNEVKLCTSLKCPIWRLRFGKLNAKTLFFSNEQKKLGHLEHGDVS